MTPFDALLLTILFVIILLAIGIATGNVTIVLRRKPQPRKPPEA